MGLECRAHNVIRQSLIWFLSGSQTLTGSSSSNLTYWAFPEIFSTCTLMWSILFLFHFWLHYKLSHNSTHRPTHLNVRRQVSLHWNFSDVDQRADHRILLQWWSFVFPSFILIGIMLRASRASSDLVSEQICIPFSPK